jgi:hypothetical protein
MPELPPPPSNSNDSLNFQSNPYAPPQAPLERMILPAEEGSLRPVPFEDLEAIPAFWKRVKEMFRLLFRNPMELFQRVTVTQGFFAPYRLTLLLSIPLILIYLAFALFFGLLFSTVPDKNAPPAWLFPLIGVGYAILMPLFLFLGMLISGALHHGLLWVFGGFKNHNAGLHQSIRVTGYYQAFLVLGCCIPIVNNVVVLGGPVLLGMAMARIHKTDTWRGVVAAYSPILLCCCLYLVFFMIGMAASGFK